MTYIIHVFYCIFAFCWYIKETITVLHEVSSSVFIKCIYLFFCYVFNDALITSFFLLASLYPSRKRQGEKQGLDWIV